MKRSLILLALLAATPAAAKTYPFTLADADAKAQTAVEQLYDAGLLKSPADQPVTLAAIWLKPAEAEGNYLFVAPFGSCATGMCHITGFRPKGKSWVKVYDQPVGEDIDISVTQPAVKGHLAIQQVDEQADKHIEKTSLWAGDKYGDPTSKEVADEPAPPADTQTDTQN